MTRWNPKCCIISTVDQTDITVNYTHQFEGADFSHRLRFPKGLLSSQRLKEIVWLKFLCHFLVNQIPPEGLQSLSELLLEHLEFYLARPISHSTKLPEQTGFISAQLVDTFERPNFQVAED